MSSVVPSSDTCEKRPRYKSDLPFFHSTLLPRRSNARLGPRANELQHCSLSFTLPGAAQNGLLGDQQALTAIPSSALSSACLWMPLFIVEWKSRLNDTAAVHSNTITSSFCGR